jgi:glutamine---fructose-6-phosphate transaminase (isomerizing)
MVSLDRLSKELRLQPKALEEFSRTAIRKVRKGSILVGAGDSYAVALAGCYTSMWKCAAFDPYHLASFPEAAEGKEVVFISASGRTSSNILAARRVKRLASSTTSITSDEASALAKATDRVVKLPMAPEPRMPGAMSSTLSLLAVLKMTSAAGPCDFRAAFAEAGRDSHRVASGRGTTYFLGNSVAHAVSVYSAAKVYELLGRRAQAQALEEFSHLQLFSLRRDDAVNVYSCFDPLGKGEKLRKELEGQGYTASRIPARGRSEVEQIFHAVFVAQLSALRRAKALGLTEPTFLHDKARLGISDSMIY